VVSLAAWLWLRFGRRPWSRLINQFHRGDRQPLPLVQSIHNIESLLNQIKWTSDTFGDWIQDPELTWGLKKGDCEDMAVLAIALLKQSGIDGYLLSVILSPSKYSHAVCVFPQNNSYHYFSNSKLIENEYQTVYNIVKFIQGAGTLICWSLENAAGNNITIK
jgi:hypothetical protein